MSKKIRVLIAVLLVQLLLAGTLMLGGTDSGAFVSGENLISLELTKVDTITIEEKETPILLLEKQGDKWHMPNYYDFPVDADKLNQVTTKLFEITKSWPVATTESARERFKVSINEFERKIAFQKDDNVLKTLFIGSSPSYRKVHARLDDDDEIYAIAFSAFEANAKAQDWASKRYLYVKSEDITDLAWPTFTISRDGENLTIKDLKVNEVVDDSKIRGLINKIANLSFSEVLGKQDRPEFHQNSPELKLAMTKKSGDLVEYTFSKLEKSDDYVLKTSADDYYFKLASYTADGLNEASKDTLLKEKVAKKEDGKVEPNSK